MPRFVARSPMPVSQQELFAWHERQGALDRLLPPWQSVHIAKRGGIRDGEEVILRLGKGPFAVSWQARHQDFDPPRSFSDRQVRGPFRSWVHQHRMLPADGGSLLEDAIDYRLPLPPLGGLGAGAVHNVLERTFAFRHRRTRHDLDRHAQFRVIARQRIAITGATGLVGAALSAFLQTGGHEVLRVTRPPRRPGDVRWDPASGFLDGAALEGCDGVVHLAGESLFALRWTEQKKRSILDSRVDGTRLLAETLARLERPPRVLVSASAIGYYGDRGDEELGEDSSHGSGFLAEVCRAWEEATQPAQQAGLRVVNLRLGVVLTAQGGALAMMLPAFRLGLGGRLGDGRQWFPWIALDDVVAAAQQALFGELSGPVNAVSPNPVTNAQFTRSLSRALRRPALIPVPAAALRALGGELAEEMLLASARVVPERLQQAGFPFEFEQLPEALAFELGQNEPTGIELLHS